MAMHEERLAALRAKREEISRRWRMYRNGDMRHLEKDAWDELEEVDREIAALSAPVLSREYEPLRLGELDAATTRVLLDREMGGRRAQESARIDTMLGRAAARREHHPAADRGIGGASTTGGDDGSQVVAGAADAAGSDRDGGDPGDAGVGGFARPVVSGAGGATLTHTDGRERLGFADLHGAFAVRLDGEPTGCAVLGIYDACIIRDTLYALPAPWPEGRPPRLCRYEGRGIWIEMVPSIGITVNREPFVPGGAG